MANLRPFRQYNENDVINLFSFRGTVPLLKGSMVKIKTGWTVHDEFEWESNVPQEGGANMFPGVVSDRWHVKAEVELNDLADAPLGMLLYDVKEHDENGEKLLWHPRKYHEMQVALKGMAVPVLTRGLVLINGIDTSTGVSVAHGVKAYAIANGGISTDPSNSAVLIGHFLGAESGDNQDVLLQLNIDNSL